MPVSKDEILNDPKFQRMAPEERSKVISRYFPGEVYDPASNSFSQNEPPPNTAQDPPSASSRFWSSFGNAVNPIPAIPLASKVIVSPYGMLSKPEGRKELYEGFVKPQVNQFDKALQYLKGGDPVTAGAYAVYGSLPGFGPALAHATEQMAEGDVAGGFGTAAGAAAPMLVTGALKAGEGTVRAGIRKVAPDYPMRLYRGAMKLPATMDRKWQENALQAGIEAGVTPTKKGVAVARKAQAPYQAKVDAVTKDGTVIGDMPASINDALAPFEEEIDRWGKSSDPERGTFLSDARDKFKDRLTQLGNRYTIAMAQTMKRMDDRIINSNVYDVDAHPGKQALVDKLMRKGQKETIEKSVDQHGGPDVKAANMMSKAFEDLVESIEEQLRKSPTFMHAYTPWIAGTAFGSLLRHLGMGEVQSAGIGVATALATIIAKEQLHSNPFLAKMAIRLNRKGIPIPLGKSGAFLSATTLNPAMAESPKTQSPPGSKQGFDPYEDPYR